MIADGGGRDFPAHGPAHATGEGEGAADQQEKRDERGWHGGVGIRWNVTDEVTFGERGGCRRCFVLGPLFRV